MKNQFSVSVVMPFFNHKRYLDESLGSILSQTLLPNEIIIVDDGSTDGSEDLLEGYKQKYPFIHVLRNKVNMGVAFSVNRGIHEATSEFVTICPSDDLLMPDFLKTSYKAVLKYPDLGIFCGDCSHFKDERPYQFKNLNFFPVASQIYLNPKEVIQSCRDADFIIVTNSAIYRRELVLKYGGYDKNLMSLMDTFLNYQIALNYPVVYVPKVLSAFRLVPTSYGNQIRFNWKLRIQLYSAFVRKLDMSEDQSFRKAFLEAGIFSLGGYFMLVFLMFKPKFWIELPFLIFKVLRQKMKRV